MVSTISDDELRMVAAVAGREGWTDLAAPPESHGPRTLDEELAVARFAAAAAAPRAAARSPWMTPLRARLAVAALTVGVLGACWIVSPTRTAIGLIGAGVFSLIALKRRARHPDRPSRARRPGGLAGRLRPPR